MLFLIVMRHGATLLLLMSHCIVCAAASVERDDTVIKHILLLFICGDGKSDSFC